MCIFAAAGCTEDGFINNLIPNGKMKKMNSNAQKYEARKNWNLSASFDVSLCFSSHKSCGF